MQNVRKISGKYFKEEEWPLYAILCLKNSLYFCIWIIEMVGDFSLYFSFICKSTVFKLINQGADVLCELLASQIFY